MASDDIALDGGQVKIFFGVLKSKKGMFEPMKAMTRIGIVPVVKKVIVQKRAAHQRTCIDIDASSRKHLRHMQAVPCDRKHMSVYRNIAMLYE